MPLLHSLVVDLERLIAVLAPVRSSEGTCGFEKRSRPRSRSGFTATMRQSRRAALRSSPSMRGWLVPGFCPNTKIASARSKSSSTTEPLPLPICSVSAIPDGSWHMFEQSGRLLVPYARTKSWYRNAASFEVRPEV